MEQKKEKEKANPKVKKKRGTKLGQAKKYDPYSLVHCKTIEDIQRLRRRYAFHNQSKLCICGCPKMWHAGRSGTKVKARGQCCYCDGKTNPNYSICKEYKYIFNIIKPGILNSAGREHYHTEDYTTSSSAPLSEGKKWGWVPGMGPDDISTPVAAVVNNIDGTMEEVEEDGS